MQYVVVAVLVLVLVLANGGWAWLKARLPQKAADAVDSVVADAKNAVVVDLPKNDIQDLMAHWEALRVVPEITNDPNALQAMGVVRASLLTKLMVLTQTTAAPAAGGKV